MKYQKLLSLTRQAVDTYQMINEGDHIAVGISGGKDSLTLLCALYGLKRFYPKSFDLTAITVNLGFQNLDLEPIKRMCRTLEIPYKIGIGEAAFYGPKLDIQIKNVYGKEDTLITIQIDQMLAEKFGMEYVDRDGVKKNPYIIHRTSIGCYERTLALLIEKYAGAFPMWLAPVQVKLLTIADRHCDYAYDIKRRLEEKGIRVELDDRNEKIGYKIREARLQKVPYMLIIGDNEVENGTLSVRERGENGAPAERKIHSVAGGHRDGGRPADGRMINLSEKRKEEAQ